MNKDDEIREELSDLWCKEITGQLEENERIRFQNLMEERKLSLPDREHWPARLRQKEEFDSAKAYRKFLQYKDRTRRRMLRRVCLTAAAAVLLFVGIGLVWSHRGQLWPVPPLAVNNEVVEPGRSKAMITLASGEKIVLGDKKQQLIEENGTLLNQDSASVRYQRNEKTAKELIYNTITVPVGGEYHLILSDGSKIWLNAGSELKFPVDFVGEEREVFLEGEAYFEVSKDQRHPFIVHTSRGAVKVLGTGFNVRDYSDEAKVVTTLVNGSVAYRSEGRPAEPVVLQPGFQIEDREGGNLQPRKVDVMMYVGWKDGKYIFENTTLEEIMQVLSRWYDVAVLYRNERVKSLHFTGDLERYDNINDFLEFMEIGGNVHFSIQGKTITIE